MNSKILKRNFTMTTIIQEIYEEGFAIGFPEGFIIGFQNTLKKDIQACKQKGMQSDHLEAMLEGIQIGQDNILILVITKLLAEKTPREDILKLLYLTKDELSDLEEKMGSQKDSPPPRK
jgi:Fic family protein